MASAIIGGMLDNGYQASDIWVSAPDDSHLQAIRKRFGVSVTTDTTGMLRSFSTQTCHAGRPPVRTPSIK